MTTLSVVMIVKNEADHLADCLATVAFADEILLLDSGSKDDTYAVVKRLQQEQIEQQGHTRIRYEINQDWQGFGCQRQRAQAFSTQEWVLMLDADERVTAALGAEIRHAVTLNDQNSVYQIKRLSYCFGQFIRHGGWYPDVVARLYPRLKVGYDDRQVHESLQVPKQMAVQTLNADLLHYTYRDLRHYLEKSAYYAALWSQQSLAKGKKSSLLQAFVHGFGCFVKMYVIRAGFLDGQAGFLLAVLSGHSTFCKYADLWLSLRQKN